MTKSIKEILMEEQIKCWDKRSKERHDLYNKVQSWFNKLDTKIDSCKEEAYKEINNIKKQTAVYQQITKTMNEKIDKLTNSFESFTKEIRENMPSKKEVEENKADVEELKKDRFKFLVYLLVSALWIIWTLCTVIYNNLFK